MKPDSSRGKKINIFVNRKRQPFAEKNNSTFGNVFSYLKTDQAFYFENCDHLGLQLTSLARPNSVMRKQQQYDHSNMAAATVKEPMIFCERILLKEN